MSKENRYIGLPIGFGFLGVSYALSALSHSFPIFPANPLTWFQLVSRPFAFAFLAFTYYFSKQKNSRLLWDLTLSILIVALSSAFVMFLVAPSVAMSDYHTLSIFVRILNIVFLLYIILHTIRSHLEAQNSKTILTPFGYMFLVISQYSLLIWGFDNNDFAFYGALVLRWTGLVLFLLIAYRTFYRTQKRSPE
jgi:hypothetical protein